MKRIKKGDTVIIIAGKSKGHIGEVVKVEDQQVFVAGGNIISKHVRSNPRIDEQGGIKKIEAAIHVSNVALYNPVNKKADRVGFRILEEDGLKRKVRYFKSNNEIVDVLGR